MQENQIIVHLKRVIWVYFFLLIFEGALRKWVFPDLAGPLLLIRDPLAIYLLIKVLQYKLWKPNNFVLLIWAVSILSLCLALILGHGNLTVAIYGLRITGIYFPLIFIIGIIFNKDDVIKVGEVLLWLNIAMTILVAVQYFSPQFAFVNRGIGGDMEGSGFSGASGYFRVPGTFSFTNGLSHFYGLVAPFIFYFWISEVPRRGFKILLILSTMALFIAIPLSISRSVLVQIIMTFLFLVMITGKSLRILPKILLTTLAIIFILTLIKDHSIFETTSEVFAERMVNANRTEGGIKNVLEDRFLGGMVESITNNSFPFWGKGLGMGTNAGAAMLTGQRVEGGFLIAEGEWGRIIGEMGLILGLILIVVRIALVFCLIKSSWNQIAHGNFLSWMLVSFGILIIIQGQWAQPTTLGFSTLIGGLILASYQKNYSSESAL